MKDPAMTWLAAARQGDENAAARLIQEFHFRVYAFLRRLCGDEGHAVELTQRTFCRAWASLAGFEGRASVSSWLHRIAYRAYVDWLRSERRLQARPDEWWEDLPDQASTPDVVAADLDASATVYAAVDRLSNGLRETIHLHYYQGLTLDETADALGVATSTVKYRVRQALDTLQGALADGRTALAARTSAHSAQNSSTNLS
jgi:RNA polymerase sigma-70 factor (ECF subfamily)